MSIFKKKIPTSCPKCGKSDGWHVVREETEYNGTTSARAVNQFSPAPIRGSFGQNATGTVGRRNKTRWRCDNCGCERLY
jgi:hypothetical protein